MKIADSGLKPMKGLRNAGVALAFSASLAVSFAAAAADAAATKTPLPLPPAAAEVPSAQPAAAPLPASGTEPLGIVGAPKVKSDHSMESDLSSEEEKVSESAKNLMKRLEEPADSTSLEDLNKAKQTISRIEAMIEVEKHLNELEKIRSERHGSSASANANALAAAIPASALMPENMVSMHEKPVVMGSPRPEVTRISGAAGVYTAALNFPNGDVKSVKVGDKVANGETVRAITASSIEIGGKETSYTLHVKNVDVVSSEFR